MIRPNDHYGPSAETQLHIAFGHLLTYDATTHSGDFLLPLHPNNSQTTTDSQTPLNTGFIKIGTLFTGPGYGLRFVSIADPDAQGGAVDGAQALIFFSDRTMEHPVCAVLLFNQTETPPWPDEQTTQGWMDAVGSEIATTQEGTQQGYIKAPAVGVGDRFDNLSDDDAVVTVHMLKQYVSDVFNSHTHGGVQSGGAHTINPDQQMDPSGSTTVRATE